jgi:D-beta-D-heptose 7-phosphate kinase/D-beta-D-heptose 1-phosphate adenosyltransferase
MLNKKLISILKKNKKNISKLKIICIGDIILDHYIIGNVERISPEAPVKILKMNTEKYEIGGVGNVAINIANLGAKPNLLCLTGDDYSSLIIKKLLRKEKNINNINVKIPSFRTPKKTRFLEDKNHLLRVDDESTDFKLKDKFKDIIIKKLKGIIKKNDLIVLSDYNKGLLDKKLICLIIKLAIKYNKKIIADPKKIDLSIYSNVDILTPNQKEMVDATNIKILNEKNLIKSGKCVVQKYNISNLLITRSEKGMLLINRDGIKKLKSNPKKVIDVTGAGDTVVAIIGLMLALKLSVNESVEISNYAAGKVIGLSGTASLKFEDLIS